MRPLMDLYFPLALLTSAKDCNSADPASLLNGELSQPRNQRSHRLLRRIIPTSWMASILVMERLSMPASSHYTATSRLKRPAQPARHDQRLPYHSHSPTRQRPTLEYPG